MAARQSENAWRVLALLFLVNLLNFFDRTIPAIVNEPIRLEWGLSDLQLGLVGSSAFTVIYALAGVPLGRLADTGSRKRILCWGLSAWSGMTAATGLAQNYLSFFLIRLGVGIGEASCTPAATSMIGDMFPAHRRATAMGVFMLGLPIGLVLAFFTTGAMVQAFGSWRAPFFIAALPGFLVAALVLLVREPARGAAEEVAVADAPVADPMRKVLRIRTMLWIVLAGVTLNFGSYAGNGFLVSLLQRYYGLPIETAAVLTGVIVGLTGLVGLTLGGRIADAVHRRGERGRLLFGAACLTAAAPLTFFALEAGAAALTSFVVLFAVGWLFQYAFYTTVYPAIHDVVQPRLRATAMALYFAGVYLLGGAAGLVVVGGLSDHFAERAMQAAGAAAMAEPFRAAGLHGAMYLIPVMMALTGLFIFMASRTFAADAARMRREMAGG
ncbi:MAG TPA: MFS transporter [Azospirillaceae bacterium]|nr:MFS transporter [Azospirillaceae bacterium]